MPPSIARTLRRRQPRTLRFHLVLLTLCGLVPLLLGGTAAVLSAMQAYRQSFELRLEDTARAMALVMDAEIERLRPTLLALAEAPAIRTEGGEEDAELYARSRRIAGHLGTSFRLLGPFPDLAMRFDTRAARGWQPAMPLDPAFRAAAQQAETTGQVVLSDLGSDGPNLRAIALLMAPLQREGKPLGVMAAVIEPAALSRKLAAQRMEAGSFATLIDSQGQIVARSAEPERFTGRSAPAWYLPGILGRDSGLASGPNLEGKPAIIAFQRLPGTPSWTMTVTTTREAYRASWTRPLAWLLAAGVAAVLAALLGTWRVGQRLTQPLALLGARAAAVARGDRPAAEPPAAPLRVAEFEALAASLEAADAALRQEAAQTGRERELLRSVLDGTADAVFAKDLSGRYVLVNAAAAAILGRSMRLILGRTDAELWPLAAPSFTATDREALQRDGPVTREEIGLVPDGGAPRIFLSTKTPWRDPATGRVIGVIGVTQEVTELRQVRQRMQAAERDLQQLARRATVGAMASGIAHELNQPLGAASNYLAGAARLLGRGPEAPDAGQRDRAVQALGRAGEQFRRAGEILRRLRDFLGGETLRQLAPVTEVVREAVDLALSGNPEAGPEEVVFEGEAAVGSAAMDRVQVQQVVVNLVRNALEAMRDMSPEHRRVLTVEVGCAGPDFVQVTVADTGPGLPEAIAGRLFEAFRSTKRDGMGVGLAICRSIVEAHGGRIGAEPVPGGGTAFRFTLARDGGLASSDPASARVPEALA